MLDMLFLDNILQSQKYKTIKRKYINREIEKYKSWGREVEQGGRLDKLFLGDILQYPVHCLPPLSDSPPPASS